MQSTRDVIVHTLRYVTGVTLDYGAGTAKYKPLIHPHSSEYISFDMFPGEHIDVVGDVLSSPFPDAHFDTIISTQVLEHVRKPWVMVAEIGRILKPGGVCIITAPFMIPYHADPYDYFRYTTEGLKSLFEEEGFEVVESGSYGKVGAVFSEMIHFSFFNPYGKRKPRTWAMRAHRTIERLFLSLDRHISNQIIYPNVYAVLRKK